MKTINKLSLLLGLCLCSAPLTAQEEEEQPKVITSSQMLGTGPTKILDTYLSQEKFSGSGLSFLSAVERQRPGSRWVMAVEHEAQLSTSNDRSDKQEELEGSYKLYIGPYYQWRLAADRLTLQAGVLGNFAIGFIYNTTNSNNPAQARLALNVMPSARADYHFRLWRKPMAVHYGLDLPLAGVMFSPNYGQSYYEIFSEGNYDHNAVFTTPFNAPSFRQRLLFDISFSRRFTFRVGYLGDYEQAQVNHLKRHVYSHRVVIGLVRRFSIVNK